MKTKKRYVILIIAMIFLFVLSSCTKNEEGKLDAISDKDKSDQGEVIHMDLKEDFILEDLSEKVAKVNGKDVYLSDTSILELEGYVNSYVEGFEELYRIRKDQGISRKDLEEGINSGFETLFRSHIEDAIKEKLYLEDMIKSEKVNKKEIDSLNKEEIQSLVRQDMNKETMKIEVNEEELDEYIKKNQGDLIQYKISFLEFTNGENVDNIKRYIDEGKTFDEFKKFLTFGDDIEINFDGEDIIYRRYSKINYNSLYNREIIKEKIDLIEEMEEKIYAVGITEDKTKYRLLRLDDKQVDPGFIKDDLKKLYKEELMIKKLDNLWNQSKIEILVGKKPLF